MPLQEAHCLWRLLQEREQVRDEHRGQQYL